MIVISGSNRMVKMDSQAVSRPFYFMPKRCLAASTATLPLPIKMS